MDHALERHKQGDVRIIPILVRPVYWQKTPFAKLQVLPTNHKPILGMGWHSQDEAFFDVAEGIRKTVEEMLSDLSDMWGCDTYDGNTFLLLRA